MLTKKEKYQYLLENGWWCNYNDNCWFEESKDELYVEDGIIKGFRPESEGIDLEKAYKQCKKNNMKEIEKELLEEKIQSRKNWIKKAQSNMKLYKSEIKEFEKQLKEISMEEIEQELFNKDRNE
jgi:hypothetical protein